MHAIPLHLKYSSGVLTKKFLELIALHPASPDDAPVPARGTRLGWGPAVTLPARQLRVCFRITIIINHSFFKNHK